MRYLLLILVAIIVYTQLYAVMQENHYDGDTPIYPDHRIGTYVVYEGHLWIPMQLLHHPKCPCHSEEKECPTSN